MLQSGLSDSHVLDPFAGSGTTLLAAEKVGAESMGIEAHPFIARIAQAKLAWRSDPQAYLDKVRELRRVSFEITPEIESYPALIHKCYDDGALEKLDRLFEFGQAQAGAAGHVTRGGGLGIEV